MAKDAKFLREIPAQAAELDLYSDDDIFDFIRADASIAVCDIQDAIMNVFYHMKERYVPDELPSSKKPTLSYIIATDGTKLKKFLKSKFELVAYQQREEPCESVHLIEGKYVSSPENIAKYIKGSGVRYEFLKDEASLDRFVQAIDYLMIAEALARKIDIVMPFDPNHEMAYPLLNFARSSQDYRTRLNIVSDLPEKKRTKISNIKSGVLGYHTANAERVRVYVRLSGQDDFIQAAAYRPSKERWEVLNDKGQRRFQRYTDVLLGFMRPAANGDLQPLADAA